MIPILNARLADTIDLLHQAKQAHWNMKGRNFIALHKSFDEIAEAADEHMDLISRTRRPIRRHSPKDDSDRRAAKRTGAIPAGYLR